MNKICDWGKTQSDIFNIIKDCGNESKIRRKAAIRLTHPDKNPTCHIFANEIFKKCQNAGEKYKVKKNTGFTEEEIKDQELAKEEFDKKNGFQYKKPQSPSRSQSQSEKKHEEPYYEDAKKYYEEKMKKDNEEIYKKNKENKIRERKERKERKEREIEEKEKERKKKKKYVLNLTNFVIQKDDV